MINIEKGNRVKHVTGGDYELVLDIKHNAGMKEGQCEINGLFWNYDDITNVLEYDGTEKYCTDEGYDY